VGQILATGSWAKGGNPEKKAQKQAAQKVANGNAPYVTQMDRKVIQLRR
jgi:hypothetical protein